MIDRKTAGKFLLAAGLGALLGYSIGRSHCPACPVSGPTAEDTRPGLQKIAASFRTICSEISPLAESIENALADDRRIDVGEGAAIWSRAQRLL
jgi:hypothetical protein